MDFTSKPPSYVAATSPVFIAKASAIRKKLSQLDEPELIDLMKISPAVAGRTLGLYRSFESKPAFWAYDGDVFKGLQARSLTLEAARYAQRHVLIASALYGLLRPFDVISPYRLEMSAKLAIDGSKNLYEYWGEQLSQYIASYRQADLLVLSSQEYSRAVTRYLLSDINVITPVFLDTRPDGSLAQIPIYNKMMRGVMARFVIDNQIDDIAGIIKFNQHDYYFDPQRSKPNQPVFTRAVMRPLVFS